MKSFINTFAETILVIVIVMATLFGVLIDFASAQDNGKLHVKVSGITFQDDTKWVETFVQVNAKGEKFTCTYLPRKSGGSTTICTKN